MIQKLLNWTAHNKHRLATFALIFGFFVDIITFRNIDLSLSQLILSVHLVIVGGAILIMAMPFAGSSTSFLGKVRSWVPVFQQYSMGNLLSAFLVLYSASGSIATSWPFLLLVAIAALGNEVFKIQKYRLPFFTTLFFLNLLLFAALAVPIALNSIGLLTFLFSVGVAIVVFTLFVRIGRIVAAHAFKTNWLLIRAGWASVALLMVGFYVVNVIPPIPLSLKTAHAYYSIERHNGTYTVERETRNWFERFLDINGETLKLLPGESAYAFTAVFAPADFSESVVHRWQFFNEQTGQWETRNTIRFPIVGGRNGGYRGFSLTENPASGKWRVSVETVRGQVLGRVYLSIERVTTPPATELFTL